MTKETNSTPVSFSFKHPFFVILGAIVIAYSGYLFGVKMYELFH